MGSEKRGQFLAHREIVREGQRQGAALFFPETYLEDIFPPACLGMICLFSFGLRIGFAQEQQRQQKRKSRSPL